MIAQIESGKRWHTGLGLGLAFVVGVAVFGSVFQIVKRFAPLAGLEIKSPAQRSVGTLSMPVFAADEHATTQPNWSLADQTGKIIIVNYFATWCPPCMGEWPDLMALSREYAPRGVVTVAVSLDQNDQHRPGESREKVLRDFVKDDPVPFPILLPPADSPLWKMDFSIPQTFIFDRQGRQALSILGRFDSRALRASLDQLLNETPK